VTDLSVSTGGTTGKLSFSSLLVGKTSAAKAVTLTNNGARALTVAPAALEGADASSFRISSDTCSSKQLAGTATCTISVVFAPTAARALSASLRIRSDSLGSPDISLPLTGTGKSVISVSPSALKWSTSLPVGTASSPSTVTVTNTGSTALPMGNLSIVGADAAAFKLSSDGCSGKTLAAYGSCSAAVVFAPTAARALTATLKVPPSDVAVPAVDVPLSGTGSSPAAPPPSPASAAAGKYDLCESMPCGPGLVCVDMGVAIFGDANEYHWIRQGPCCLPACAQISTWDPSKQAFTPVADCAADELCMVAKTGPLFCMNPNSPPQCMHRPVGVGVACGSGFQTTDICSYDSSQALVCHDGFYQLGQACPAGTHCTLTYDGCPSSSSPLYQCARCVP
jgi:hypothetical protein